MAAFQKPGGVAGKVGGDVVRTVKKEVGAVMKKVGDQLDVRGKSGENGSGDVDIQREMQEQSKVDMARVKELVDEIEQIRQERLRKYEERKMAEEQKKRVANQNVDVISMPSSPKKGPRLSFPGMKKGNDERVETRKPPSG